MTARRISEVLFGMLPMALILALWQDLAASGMAPPSLLPAPRAVFLRFAEQIANPTFLGHVATTLLRLFVGFAIAVVVGVTLGVAATGNRAFGAALRPVVRVLAPVPKIALVAADATFPILLATYQGTSAVEPKLVWSALAAGTSRKKALFTVVLPAALPSVLTGCRIGLVISCIVVFLAEMITSTNGLGHLLIYAARSFETVDMFVPLITISLLGLVLNAAFNALQRRLLIGFPETG